MSRRRYAQGTSLAITQAYVLAQKLADALDAGTGHEHALWRYESRLREFTALNQALVNGDGTPPSIIYEQIRAGVFALSSRDPLG